MTKVFVFPGQGSQKVGMGKDLFSQFPDLVRQADEQLGYSIEKLCLEDPDKQITFTQYTQPALYTVNALSHFAKLQAGERPEFVAGHSLGEYNALLAAEVFDFVTGLRIVQKRGELMGRVSGSSMGAVVGISPEKIAEVIQNSGFSTIDIANFNTPTQTVIAGSEEEIKAARSVFKDAGARYVVLNVSAAFHSRFMQQARDDFAQFLEKIPFHPPKIPVIANVTARPHLVDEIRTTMAQQITSSVRWVESVQVLMSVHNPEFVEVGPGNVLTRLVSDIQKNSSPIEIDWNHYAPQRSSPSSSSSVSSASSKITADSLGCSEFKREYGVKYAYISGAMYKGIASEDLVVCMGKAGLIGFLGTGGLDLTRVENAIQRFQRELPDKSYGLNLLCDLIDPQKEESTVDLYLKYGVRHIEAAAYMQMTSALVRYRLHNIYRDPAGNVIAPNKIIAKISRPEVATVFMSPAPERIIKKLLESGKITAQAAELSKEIPMSEDVCVEADSGGHTDQGVAYALMPAMLRLRDEMMQQYKYHKKIRVGAAGGIGAPESAAAAFILGADFILTGSINQCTVEAGTSDVVKDMLQQINVQDTAYAPAGDMFEIGAKVQVMRKGVFFPARANKLYDLYRQFNSLDEIDEKTKKQIQEKYFNRSFDEVWKETKDYYAQNHPKELERAERNPKQKMALIFRWYFIFSNRMAMQGNEEQKVNYQIQCGPALGAFNQWVKGTELENWRNRHVDTIAEKLMQGTADYLNQRFTHLTGKD